MTMLLSRSPRAGADAGFEHVGMDLEQRQALADTPRLVEHEPRILEGLAHAPLWREVARQHFRALGVHDL